MMGLSALFLQSKETSEPSGSFAHSANSLMIPQPQFNTLYITGPPAESPLPKPKFLCKTEFRLPANPIRALKLARSGNSSFEVN